MEHSIPVSTTGWLRSLSVWMTTLVGTPEPNSVITALPLGTGPKAENQTCHARARAKPVNSELSEYGYRTRSLTPAQVDWAGGLGVWSMGPVLHAASAPAAAAARSTVRPTRLLRLKTRPGFHP